MFQRYRPSMTERLESSSSSIISRALDRLGYSFDMIQYKQDFFNRLNKCMHERAFIVGSKAEGITKFTESDIDCLYIPKRLVCVEDPADVVNAAGTLLMDTSDVMPGYTRLKLITPIELVGENMAKYFCDRGDRLYLSSSSFVSGHQEFAAGEGKISERAGPSIPGISLLSFDSVTAFECKCKTIFENFCKRKRSYYWPSRFLLQDFKDNFIYAMVAPVGYKTSPTEQLEWRICCTLVEVRLIQTLCEAHMKLYVLLKAITKEVINKIVPDTMTSYFVKNIVFWMAETTPSELLKEELFVDRLTDALSYMKESVESGFLKNYIIPERNLFSGKLTEESAPKLAEFLGQLIKEGHRVVERVPLIYDAVLHETKNPKTALAWQHTSDADEKYRLDHTLKIMKKALRK